MFQDNIKIDLTRMHCEHVGWIKLKVLVVNFGKHNNELCVQVTVHHDKPHTKQPSRCIKYPKFILS